jgi:predicted RNase H-like nuclease
MRYIGIDLAWGNRNSTAAIALCSAASGVEYLAHADTLTDNESIAAFVGACDNGGGLVVAVDAPTRVPNQTGRRPCEGTLSRCMRVHEAGPHPANRALLSDADGNIRGETLVALLAERFGIAHTPYLVGESPRAVFEAFPHPAHVALFDLAKTLKYKKKTGRHRASRDAEFRRYSTLLVGLAGGDPPLLLTPESSPWLWRDLAEFASEAALKRHEDLLDALTCAYVAAYHHRWQGDRCVVVGDTEAGYIVTPATEAMKSCFFAGVVAVQ